MLINVSIGVLPNTTQPEALFLGRHVMSIQSSALSKGALKICAYKYSICKYSIYSKYIITYST